MTTFRTTRLLATAALALIAIGALGVANAQAGIFKAGAYPATITGTSAAASHEFTTQLGVMKCAPSFHAEMEADSGVLTVTPNFGTSCTIGGKQVHVNNNGCDFRFHAGATQMADVVTGSMDIFCPTEAKMDFEITSEPTCHLTVPGQAGIGTLTYTNNTMAKDVNVDFGLEFIFYELDFGCAVVGAFMNGSYKGSSTLKADHEGAGTPFKVE